VRDQEKCLHQTQLFVALRRLRDKKKRKQHYLGPMNNINTYFNNMPAPAGAGMGYDAPDYGMRHGGRGMFV
jgi:hypothetical protein